MMQFDSSDDGVLNILKVCGIEHKSIKSLSDLIGLTFEFHYKKGIITQIIENVYLTTSEGDSSDNNPQLEISLKMQQSQNFICLFCVVKNTLFVPEKPDWQLKSINGRDGKNYSGIFKLIYPEI